MPTKAKVVVFLPGTTASSLVSTKIDRQGYVPGTVVWPTKVLEAALLPAKQLALLEIPTLAPHRIFTSRIGFIDVYGKLVDFFARSGFHCLDTPADLGELTRHHHSLPQNLFIAFPYDWRVNNVYSADSLAATVQKLNSLYDGKLEIWLIGHSMGGLVSRGALETGKLAGQPIAGLITLATPHLGAPLALSAVLGAVSLLGVLSAYVIRSFIDDAAFPSTYELLPPPPVTFVTQKNGGGESIYDGPVNDVLVAAHKASKPNFRSACGFFAGLDYGSAPTPVPYHLVYGINTRKATETAYHYDPTHKHALKVVESAKGGDGVVPVWSATFNDPASAVAQKVASHFEVVGVTHGSICKSKAVFNYLAQTIGFTPDTATMEDDVDLDIDAEQGELVSDSGAESRSL